MRLKDKKYAFSLTELLIVLVVLAVLFAALAPILTTRHNGASVSTENIWNYVNDDEQQKIFTMILVLINGLQPLIWD